ncbi:DUF1707 SHOCT-like domain-containing protein [Allonocardiopsis opalescens]|uniref:Uncharacterized protein DUF1707 n=1 Tax=Allonocardiopsis opalescens TaxID=1144618 RepID=A0A2T0Q0I9_9ACTN|nr:DUF1707 domain-containing protein [Allonocardiopsis opalescens]PRX97225.1 uncharacterized protein DUF1707 [Allonocardiopsis opalescens]
MSEPPEPADRRQMRASDADRDKVAEVLREAAAEGRLDLAELDERIDALYRARTYAELEPITRDLPAQSRAAAARPAAHPAPARRIGGRATSSSAFAIMSGAARKGRWTIGERFTSGAFWGGVEIDLREADFAAETVAISAYAFQAGIHIIVPEDVEVDMRGIGVMGGFGSAAGSGTGTGPTIVVKGFALMGGVSVTRKPRQQRPGELDRSGRPGIEE